MNKSRYLFGGKTEMSKAGIKRLLDANSLMRQGRWRGAMYLAGYGLECKLKVCLMEMHRVHHLRHLRLQVGQEHLTSHDLEHYFTFTRKLQKLRDDDQAMKSFRICNKWIPAWRYNPDDGSENECKIFMDAIKDLIKFIVRK